MFIRLSLWILLFLCSASVYAQLPGRVNRTTKASSVSTAAEALKRYKGFVLSCGTGCRKEYTARRIYKSGNTVHVIFRVVHLQHKEEVLDYLEDIGFTFSARGALLSHSLPTENTSRTLQNEATLRRYAAHISGLRHYDTHTEVPPDGVYTYDVEQAEFRGLITAKAVRVIIRGRYIKVVNLGILTGGKGSVMAEGTIRKHKSGTWIIAQKESDVYSNEVGGCTDGPMEIDFVTKTLLIC